MSNRLPWHAPRAVFDDTAGILLDTPPEILLDLRFAELEAARVAADQVLVELVANARDAALAQPSGDPSRVLLGLHGGTLLLANDGAPFDRSGYLAIRRIARSSKRGAQAAPASPLRPMTLGRHGLGFRSVLAVTDRPRIYGRAKDGAPFALGFGEPRIGALCRAALRGDEAGCEAALPPEERPWLHALLAQVPLGQRSLARHGAHSDVSAEELTAGLPVLPFPVALDPGEVPAAVAEVLGWRGGPEHPYTTVVELGLREAELERCLDRIEAQIPTARRCLMGTRIRLILAGAGASA